MDAGPQGRRGGPERLPAERSGDCVLDIRLQERPCSASPQGPGIWAERIRDAAAIDDIFTDSRPD